MFEFYALKQDKINDAIVYKVKEIGRLYFRRWWFCYILSKMISGCATLVLPPSDNVSELTARINDNGWENVMLIG